MMTTALTQDLPLTVSPDDYEALYYRSQEALTTLEIEISHFPAALEAAVREGDVDLILTLRRRRVEAEVQLDAAQLVTARFLVLLREQHSARAIASVTGAHAPLAHAERVLGQAQAMHQSALNNYVQACSDRDFSAYDLRQAKSEFARLTAQQTAAATQTALRQRL